MDCKLIRIVSTEDDSCARKHFLREIAPDGQIRCITTDGCPITVKIEQSSADNTNGPFCEDDVIFVVGDNYSGAAAQLQLAELYPRANVVEFHKTMGFRGVVRVPRSIIVYSSTVKATWDMFLMHYLDLIPVEA